MSIFALIVKIFIIANIVKIVKIVKIAILSIIQDCQDCRYCQYFQDCQDCQGGELHLVALVCIAPRLFGLLAPIHREFWVYKHSMRIVLFDISRILVHLFFLEMRNNSIIVLSVRGPPPLRSWQRSLGQIEPPKDWVTPSHFSVAKRKINCRQTKVPIHGFPHPRRLLIGCRFLFGTENGKGWLKRTTL